MGLLPGWGVRSVDGVDDNDVIPHLRAVLPLFTSNSPPRPTSLTPQNHIPLEEVARSLYKKSVSVCNELVALSCSRVCFVVIYSLFSPPLFLSILTPGTVGFRVRDD